MLLFVAVRLLCSAHAATLVFVTASEDCSSDDREELMAAILLFVVAISLLRARALSWVWIVE